MSDNTETLLSPRLARTITYLFFAVLFIGVGVPKVVKTLATLSIAWICFSRSYDFSSWISTRRKVALVYLLQLVGWLALIPVEFLSFEYNNFDTGIFAKNIIHWRQTGEYYSSILGMHAFADHFTPNLLLLAPLFAVWNSFLWLPILKVLAWAWSVYLLAGFARDVLGKSSPYLYLAPGVYLLNQFVANSLLMEFQPSSLAIPFIVLAFRLAHHERIIPLLAVLIGMLGFKEHLGVVWISFGLFLMLEKRRTFLGLSILMLGTIEGFLVYKLLMPVFAGGAIHHDGRIAPFSGISRKAALLFTAVVSFGGLPLLARYGLLYALPGFVLVLMGGESGMQSFDHHYHDVGFIMLACGSVLGLRALNDRERFSSVTAQRISNAVVLIALSQAMRFPTFYIRHEWPSAKIIAIHRDLPKIHKLVADYAPAELWTLDHLGPYFLEVPNLKSIKGPFLPPAAPGSDRRLIVISPLVDSYPLWRRDYEKLESYLPSQYTEVTYSAGVTSELRVFASKEYADTPVNPSGSH